MECAESKSSPEFRVWKQIFGDEDSVSDNSIKKLKKNSKKRSRKPQRTFREGVLILAAKLLMGATGYNDGMDEATGEMRYSFTRPIGGHGKAYVDILHLGYQNR